MRTVKQTLNDTLEKDSSLLTTDDDVTEESAKLVDAPGDVTQSSPRADAEDSVKISQVLEQFSEILEDEPQQEVELFVSEEVGEEVIEAEREELVAAEVRDPVEEEDSTPAEWKVEATNEDDDNAKHEEAQPDAGWSSAEC